MGAVVPVLGRAARAIAQSHPSSAAEPLTAWPARSERARATRRGSALRDPARRPQPPEDRRKGGVDGGARSHRCEARRRKCRRVRAQRPTRCRTRFALRNRRRAAPQNEPQIVRLTPCVLDHRPTVHWLPGARRRAYEREQRRSNGGRETVPGSNDLPEFFGQNAEQDGETCRRIAVSRLVFRAFLRTGNGLQICYSPVRIRVPPPSLNLSGTRVDSVRSPRVRG